MTPKRFLQHCLVLMLMAVGYTAITPSTAQAQPGACYLCLHYDDTWHCDVLPSPPGYKRCTVGGSSCLISGDCEPQLARADAIAPDGTFKKRAGLKAPIKKTEILADGRVVQRLCGGAIDKRTYTAAAGERLRADSDALTL